MSPALNGSSALERFKRSSAIEVCNGICSQFLPRTACTDATATYGKLNSNLLVYCGIGVTVTGDFPDEGVECDGVEAPPPLDEVEQFFREEEERRRKKEEERRREREEQRKREREERERREREAQERREREEERKREREEERKREEERRREKGECVFTWFHTELEKESALGSPFPPPQVMM